MVCYRQQQFGQENAKTHLKIAYFGGHISKLPDFGRTWTPAEGGEGQERDGEFQHKSAHIRGNFERSFDLRSVDI